MAKLKHQEITRTSKEGETVTISKSYSTKTTSESFYMCFIDNMSGFFKISCITDVKILAKLCTMAEFNTGNVKITAQDRQNILESLQGLSTQNLSHSLNRLRKLGLIEGEKGNYNINPKVFWKGTTNERERLIKLQGLEINIKFNPEDNIEEETKPNLI